MKLFKAQLDAIKSKEKVTALIGSYGSGKTVAAVSKAIMNQGKVTIFCPPGLKYYVKMVYDEILKELKEYNHKITIIDYDEIDKLKYQDLIILEDFEIFSYINAKKIYNKVQCFTQKIFITANPGSKYPLDRNFVYQLCKEKFCNNIHINLNDNPNLPEDFLPYVMNHHKDSPFFIKGNFK